MSERESLWHASGGLFLGSEFDPVFVNCQDA